MWAYGYISISSIPVAQSLRNLYEYALSMGDGVECSSSDIANRKIH